MVNRMIHIRRAGRVMTQNRGFVKRVTNVSRRKRRSCMRAWHLQTAAIPLLLGFLEYIFLTHSLSCRLSKGPVLRVTQLAMIIGCNNLVEGSGYIWFGILLRSGRML